MVPGYYHRGKDGEHDITISRNLRLEWESMLTIMSGLILPLEEGPLIIGLARLNNSQISMIF